MNAAMAEPDFYSGAQSLIDQVLEQVAKIKSELEAAYARWEELE